MALVNPNIAMSYRQPDIQGPNALAQFAQIQQIQGGRQAQELAQYQLGAAQRGEAREVARINALAGAGTDETAVANALLRSGDIAGYSAFVKAAEDRRTQKLTQQKTEGEIAGQPLARQKTQGDIDAQQIVAAKGRADAFSTALAPLVGAVQAKKPITHQDVFAQANRLVSQGLLRKEDLYSIPINVAELPNFVMNMASSTENSRKALETYLPKALVAGGDVINVNPLAEGGVGKPLSRVSMTEAQIAQNRIAQEQLGVSQGQLNVAQRNANLAQAKFAFEKANPTMSIQEDPTGLLAVNTRTGVATPVVYGPNGIQAAPTAPSASMMRPPEAELPGPRISAIPSMNSVLDRTAAPVAMPMPAVEGGRFAGAPVSSKREAPAKFNDTDMQLAGLTGSLKEFKEEVGKKLTTGAKFLPSGADTARMQAKYTALLMGVKDLYTLGALTGPDMSIIESQLTNPASWAGKMTTQKGFEEQTKVIEDMLKRTAGNLENTYNRQPRATKKALESLGSGIPGASANDPLGLGIKGR